MYYFKPEALLELLGHVQVLEDDLREEQRQASEAYGEIQMVLRVTMKELAEAKAEIARLQAELKKADVCDHCPRFAVYRTCSECGVMMGDNKR